LLNQLNRRFSIQTATAVVHAENQQRKLAVSSVAGEWNFRGSQLVEWGVHPIFAASNECYARPGFKIDMTINTKNRTAIGSASRTDAPASTVP